ncbi:MAG: site-specific integrase [Bacillota bacterium]|nr:site-specific integrase [Bacillota bacterium]
MSVVKRIPEPLNNYEQLALLKQPNPRAPTGLRNLCIISLMLKTGMRVSEIINLQVNDIDWDKCKIHIRESGAARKRTLWLDRAEIMLLKSWQSINPAKGPIFFTTLDGSMLKDRYIREMVKRLARKAGIAKDVYPHLLRYTFAVDFIRETRDIKLLQDALGHREISATQIYTRLLFDSKDIPDITSETATRSGMPASDEDQKQINFNEFHDDKKIPNQDTIRGVISKNVDKSHSEKRAILTGEAKENIAVEERLPMNNSNGYTYGINRPDKTQQKPSERLHDRMEGKQADEALKPTIAVVSEETTGDQKKIPAIKCSNCSFILHYQGDCPQCGASFNEIMRHWGKII